MVIRVVAKHRLPVKFADRERVDRQLDFGGRLLGKGPLTVVNAKLDSPAFKALPKIGDKHFVPGLS